MFMADGWLGAGINYVWQVALFVSVGRNIARIGGAMALAALVGAVLGMLLGRHVDTGRGRRAVVIAYGATSGLSLAQALSFGSPWLAVAANALLAVVGSLIIAAMWTATYNLAQASPCPLRFNFATEGAWDIGCGGGVLTARGDLGARRVARLSRSCCRSPAIAASVWLLWRYYGDHPSAGGVEIAPAAAAQTLGETP